MILRWLTERFVRKPATGLTIHIHEDAWAMRSLHPLAACDDVRHDLTVAQEASERNRAPGGGWSSLHIVQQPKIDFAAVGLKVDRVVAAVEPLMPRVRRFYSTVISAIGQERGRDGLGSYDDDAICFGFDHTCFVKVDAARDDVKAIWFERLGTDPSKLNALRHALEAIDLLTPCILADYWLDIEGPVGDAAFLDRYFMS